ncbi:MAG: hypothetical protein UT07_C0025G0007 [Parcubacteria group bacterium GW2011_GWB1_38_8]|uniref:Type 4 fimbrial biogenesis protein PilX N-terminal domain-containing protein n=1 Tax=Candidatus Zambryskibacteria bacterium RIFCSPLOWO2_02_FULL_39_14 TaxID=1802769 RepID=A0A1G2UGA0_9BACT|nr:MAG: hypothetical protein UT07_C0025G0007 [Parcubacteria group bacterium GW2011_GWB1_38_8]KKR30935.1 MAG: hypothetical protein UT62_C0004G0019 [Parcubacteria group bacterium GW2011_GWC1_39_8]OHA94520.1 MAG: hypothetical protein A3C62_02080 [Candidatus Zambryskibacteria bacterium RIFCSPHIGHO2_02_FULL_39_16]OHB08425.1 MAG: hypothetical protein A3I86_01040 [Candidatus Zambryskibacteria bacterium RIFCSPLOWO2_02_FULL_39_14]
MKIIFNKIKKRFSLNTAGGFTLFVSIILMGTLLLIAGGIVSLAKRQLLVSASGHESQHAFYAADTGIECALFWDIQSPTGISAFSTSSTSTIFCNRDANNSTNQWTVGGGPTSVINRIDFAPDPYCAIVTVTKVGVTTQIESKGYNTCSVSNTRRVERAVRVTY